jgi:T5SS/PEP-CTERM-associated repeat protein
MFSLFSKFSGHRSLCAVNTAALLCGMLAVGVICPSASAWPTFDWISSVGGTFKQSVHWTPGGPPGVADLARFLLPGPYTVNFDDNATTDQLHIDAPGPIVFNLAGHTYSIPGSFPGAHFKGQQRVTGGTLNTQYAVLDGTLELDQASTNWENLDRIYIGYGSSGLLEVHSGAQLSTWRFYIGNDSRLTGSLSIHDPGTYVNCPGGLVIVGASGPGSLNLTNLAVLESTGAEIAGEYDSPGIATVSNGAQWIVPDTFYVGLKDHAILNVVDGGSINSQWFVIAGEQPEASAEILVQNLGSLVPSTWDIGVDLNLGQAGDASMVIESNSVDHQALVSVADSMFISYSPQSSSGLTVTGPGSHLEVTDPASGVFVVGAFGPGEMTIDNGATVQCRIGELAGDFGAQGQATVKNGGAWIMQTDGLFGLKGPATLNIESGGTVVASGYISIGDFAAGDGHVFVRDLGGMGSAALSATGNLFVGHFGKGLLSIESETDADHAQVSVGSNLEIAKIFGSIGIVKASGTGSQLAVNSAIVGRGGNGTLELREGASVTATNVVLAEDPASVGTVLIDQSSASDPVVFSVAHSLTVGRRAVGNFDVVSPAALTIPQCIIGESVTSNGAMTLSGPDVSAAFNQFLEIGQKGAGSMTLTNVNTSAPIVTAGVFPNSHGTLNVHGGTLVASNGPLTIGYEGHGVMTASGGAVINCNALPDGLVVAAKPNSSGNLTITDPGTIIEAERQFAIERNGIVTVTNHGTLRCHKGISPTSSAGIIATNEPSIASMVVSDHGWLDCVDGFVNVGFRNNTNGTMLVTDSGKITSVGGFIGREPGSIGQFTVDGAGSQWLNSATVTVGELGVGTLTVNNNGLVTAPNLIVGVNGKLAGAGGIITSPVLNKKLVAPGNATSPTGLLSINGDYTQIATAKLAIDLAGTTPGSGHDQLALNGNVSLNGALEIAAAPGFKPQPCQTFQIVLACSGCTISGSFAQVIPADVYEIIYNADSVIVKVPGGAPPCAADIAPEKSGGNGIIDVDDLLMVINAWATCPGGTCLADITADGNVDVDDLLAVINAWGVCP